MLISTVAFLVLVASNTMLSPVTGTMSSLQFAASDQLLVDPPPSHVFVTNAAWVEKRKVATKTIKNITSDDTIRNLTRLIPDLPKFLLPFISHTPFFSRLCRVLGQCYQPEIADLILNSND